MLSLASGCVTHTAPSRHMMAPDWNQSTQENNTWLLGEKHPMNTNGSWPEWCISTIYHAWDTSFWPRTLKMLSPQYWQKESLNRMNIVSTTKPSTTTNSAKHTQISEITEIEISEKIQIEISVANEIEFSEITDQDFWDNSSQNSKPNKLQESCLKLENQINNLMSAWVSRCLWGRRWGGGGGLGVVCLYREEMEAGGGRGETCMWCWSRCSVKNFKDCSCNLSVLLFKLSLLL